MRAVARPASPTCRAASPGVHCPAGSCERATGGVIRFLRTRYVFVVSDETDGVHRAPSAARFRKRLHPLVSFAPLQSPTSRTRRRCHHRRRLPWGSRSLFATSPDGVRADGFPGPPAFPSAAFLTPSTVYSAIRLVGLFRPTATSRVRPSGVFPRAQPATPRRRRRALSSLAKVRCRCCHRRHVPPLRPQGFAARESVVAAPAINRRDHSIPS